MFDTARARVTMALMAVANLFNQSEYRPSKGRGALRSADRWSVETSAWGRWRRPRQEGELGRRLRQIRAGTYTLSNGLVMVTEGGWVRRVNSHGEITW